MNKRGRPCTDDARKNQYRLRMTDDELDMLDYIVEKTGKTKAEILREALRSSYNFTRYLN